MISVNSDIRLYIDFSILNSFPLNITIEEKTQKL